MKPYVFRTVNGLPHLVMTKEEWRTTPKDYRGVVFEGSHLHKAGVDIGTKSAMCLHPQHGTTIAPVIIEK
jgi:hypothetical protein